MATDDQIRIVRALIPDTEAVFGDNEDELMFSNENISDFVTAGGNSVLRAAALACLAIGTSEALISKVIKTQDLMTNGAAVADAMAKKADLLFKRAAAEDANTNAEFFQIIDYGEGWGVYPPELTEWNWGYYR